MSTIIELKDHLYNEIPLPPDHEMIKYHTNTHGDYKEYGRAIGNYYKRLITDMLNPKWPKVVKGYPSLIACEITDKTIDDYMEYSEFTHDDPPKSFSNWLKSHKAELEKKI